MKKNPLLAMLAVVIVVVIGLYATHRLNGVNTPFTNDNAAKADQTGNAIAADSASDSDTKKSSGSADDSKVMATYDGGKTLTKGEINEKIKLMSGGKMPEGKGDIEQFPKDVQANIIKGVITGKLVLADAIKSGVENDPKVKVQLDAAREQVLEQSFLSEKIKQSVNDAAVKARYDSFIKEDSNKEEIHARHILVKTKEEADKIEKELKAGSSFEDLAKKYSLDNNKDKGGDLGYFTRGQMVKEFEDAAFALKVGEVSQPVKTDFGWHIIKVEDRRKAAAPSFSDVKTKLEQDLDQKAAQNYIETLQKNANIQIVGDNKDTK